MVKYLQWRVIWDFPSQMHFRVGKFAHIYLHFPTLSLKLQSLYNILFFCVRAKCLSCVPSPWTKVHHRTRQDLSRFSGPGYEGKAEKLRPLLFWILKTSTKTANSKKNCEGLVAASALKSRLKMWMTVSRCTQKQESQNCFLLLNFIGKTFFSGEHHHAILKF